MKIILASDLSFLLQYGYDLAGISKSEMKIGYVMTASKGEGESTRLFFEGVKRKIKEQGYFFEEIDIEGKSKDELRSFFKNKNVIHVDGGNTFYLLKAIRETGFDEILKELLSDGKVYIGTSAGAYVMCPTIEVSSWSPDSKNMFGVTDFTALNYVPFVLKVHYKDEEEKLIKEKMKTLKYPLRILRNGQGIFAENNTYTFVGEGEEVIINTQK